MKPFEELSMVHFFEQMAGQQFNLKEIRVYFCGLIFGVNQWVFISPDRKVTLGYIPWVHENVEVTPEMTRPYHGP